MDTDAAGDAASVLRELAAMGVSAIALEAPGSAGSGVKEEGKRARGTRSTFTRLGLAC